MNKLSLAGLITASLLLSNQALAKTEIEWWHAMGGANNDKINEIAANFNAKQDEYEIKPVYKGSYSDTMTGAIAAFRSKQQPAIVQVFEVGTATMMGAKEAIYPVYQLMEDTKQAFHTKDYLSSVMAYYTDEQGRMISMPFNSSTPVLYYNKELFEKAGIKEAPKTWQQMEEVAQKLVESGVKCAFTTSWQSWTQIENFGARHDVPMATKNNGFGGFDTEFTFNSAPFVKHIDRLAKWSKEGIFKYGGRQSDSTSLFYNQECAITMGSSASLSGVKQNMSVPFGVSQLPYDAEQIEQPLNSIIGGGSLWVLRGHSDEEYKGVAEFFSYLSSAEVQADWHQFTGYLPITTEAYELSKSQGYYEKNPGTDTGILQMTSAEPTVNSKGIRFGNYLQGRAIINEELEKVWSGAQTAQQALDNAVKRGNEQLRRFERTQK